MQIDFSNKTFEKSNDVADARRCRCPIKNNAHTILYCNNIYNIGNHTYRDRVAPVVWHDTLRFSSVKKINILYIIPHVKHRAAHDIVSHIMILYSPMP